jgi:hypothetical protein
MVTPIKSPCFSNLCSSQVKKNVFGVKFTTIATNIYITGSRLNKTTFFHWVTGSRVNSYFQLDSKICSTTNFGVNQVSRAWKLDSISEFFGMVILQKSWQNEWTPLMVLQTLLSCCVDGT